MASINRHSGRYEFRDHGNGHLEGRNIHRTWHGGAGPPLLLVHGTTYGRATAWGLVAPELERRFPVCAMDRRGRGGSGDSANYDLQREAEDVATVVDFIGEPVSLFGYSHGALCVLDAALPTDKLHRLIL